MPLEDSLDLLVVNAGSGANANTEVSGSNAGYRVCVTGPDGRCSHPFWSDRAGEFYLSAATLSVSLGSNVADMVLDKLGERGQAEGELEMEHTRKGYEFMLHGAADRTPWYRIHRAGQGG